MKKLLACMLALVLILGMSACVVTDGSATRPSHVDSDIEGDPAQTGAAQTGGTTIEETVLLDASNVKITAKKIEEGWLGTSLKLLIENNSDQDLMVQCRDSSVNGYMVDTLFSTSVAAGKKANDSITFASGDLEACGIQTIADMEFRFHIFLADGWDDYYDSDLIQLRTSAAASYQYTYDDSGEVLFEKDGVRIVTKGLSTQDSFFGPGLVVYIENTRDRAIMVQTRDVSVNGFMVNAIISSNVGAGKRAVDAVTFLQSDLEENGITEIKDMEISFHIFDSDTWDTVFDSEPVKLTF